MKKKKDERIFFSKASHTTYFVVCCWMSLEVKQKAQEMGRSFELTEKDFL
jgi:hypothetical protein